MTAATHKELMARNAEWVEYYAEQAFVADRRGDRALALILALAVQESFGAARAHQLAAGCKKLWSATTTAATRVSKLMQKYVAQSTRRST